MDVSFGADVEELSGCQSVKRTAHLLAFAPGPHRLPAEPSLYHGIAKARMTEARRREIRFGGPRRPESVDGAAGRPHPHPSGVV